MWTAVALTCGIAVLAVGAMYSKPPGCRGCQKAPIDIRVLREALEQYALENDGRYPMSLRALVEVDESGHRFLSQERLPRDPWNREYVYVREPVNVLTLGADGRPGGTGDEVDIDFATIADWR